MGNAVWVKLIDFLKNVEAACKATAWSQTLAVHASRESEQACEVHTQGCTSKDKYHSNNETNNRPYAAVAETQLCHDVKRLEQR